MNKDKLLILGSGYTGQELTRLAVNAGYTVVGTTRDEDTREFLRSHGAIPIEWSVGDDPAPWIAHLGPKTSVVYSIPTLFRSYEGADGGDLPRHITPMADVLTECRQAAVKRVIYLSSTSVYGDHGGDWVDESTKCHPSSDYGKMRYDIESYLMEAETDFPITIARLVGIYGPGRTLIDAIKQGRYTLVDGGKKITNRVHVHDIARALLAIIERGPDSHRVFNITDGHPQHVRDLVEFICDEAGLETPIVESLDEFARRRKSANAVARWKKQIRVLNERLRRELDLELVYPDVFSGYRAILESDADAPVST